MECYIMSISLIKIVFDDFIQRGYNTKINE